MFEIRKNGANVVDVLDGENLCSAKDVAAAWKAEDDDRKAEYSVWEDGKKVYTVEMIYSDEIGWFPLPIPGKEPKRCLGPDISSVWVWKRDFGFRVAERALKRYTSSDKGFRLWEKSWILVTTCLMTRLGNNASKF